MDLLLLGSRRRFGNLEDLSRGRTTGAGNKERGLRGPRVKRRKMALLQSTAFLAGRTPRKGRHLAEAGRGRWRNVGSRQGHRAILDSRWPTALLHRRGGKAPDHQS